MPSVLIRDVPDDELEVLRGEATAGQSLQAYLLEVLHARTVHARRQEALREVAARLADGAPVGDEDRQSVFDEVAAVQADHARQLTRDR